MEPFVLQTLIEIETDQKTRHKIAPSSSQNTYPFTMGVVSAKKYIPKFGYIKFEDVLEFVRSRVHLDQGFITKEVKRGYQDGISQRPVKINNTKKDDDKMSNKEKMDAKIAFIKDHYDGYFDEIEQRVYFKHPHYNNEYYPLDENLSNIIFQQFIENDLGTRKDIFDRLFTTHNFPIVNVAIAYLKSLPERTGDTAIRKLADAITTTDLYTKEEIVLILTKKFCAIVASMHNRKEAVHIDDTILIFQGGQGVNKSTFVPTLIPEKLKKYSFTGTLNFSNKEGRMRLSTCIFIISEEMEVIKMNGAGSIKENISKYNIRERLPFEKHDTTFPRRASFFGTTNKLEFLTDTTGNRRYITLPCVALNRDHGINIDEVYAEALTLFKAKNDGHYYTEDERKWLNEKNKTFEEKTMEEEFIESMFAVPASADAVDDNIGYYNASQILELMSDKHKGFRKDNSSRRTIGKVMTKLMFPKKKVEGLYKYVVVNIGDFPGLEGYTPDYQSSSNARDNAAPNHTQDLKDALDANDHFDFTDTKVE